VRSLSRSWFAGATVAIVAIVFAPGSASAKKPLPPPPPPASGGGTSTTSTYVKNYANVLNGVEYQLTAADVQSTSDGGWLALADTQAPSGVGVSWLVKANAVGALQWQEEIGCLNTPPGAYSDELSLRRTSDGGYVLGGGTVGCGSGANCPSLSGLQCGLVEKVDGTGHVLWARVYSAGPNGTVIDQVEPTSDGGFVAVGSVTDSNGNPAALVLKLDGVGDIQWQRKLARTGAGWSLFGVVRQTSDGGYIAVGEVNDGSNGSTGEPLVSILAVKLDAAGNVTWQHGFNDVGSSGVTAVEHAKAVVQTSDGGYAIGGDWKSQPFADECCQGALLLKLTSSGAIEWQKAYSGGVQCYFNGYSETCNTVGGGVDSLHQTADGGYLLAGDADDPQLVPWLAKVDGNGALVWQKTVYQTNPRTGRPISEDFASSALTPVGPLAIGFTENPTSGTGELLGVQTDANGNIGTCGQVHTATALSAVDPGLAQISPGLAVDQNIGSQSPAPVQTQATAAAATASQC